MTMSLKYGARLRANALFITIILTLVISVICTMMLILGYNRMRIDGIVGTESRLERNLGSAIDMVLADTTLIEPVRKDTLDLFGEGKDTVTINRENWGLFSVANVVATVKGKTETRSFFFGQAADSPLNGCLWLSTHQSALSLVGNTRLKGNAYIPKQGLLPGYINQRGFAFERLILGDTRNSGDSLPGVDPRLITLITQQLRSKVSAVKADSLKQSFADTAMIIYRKEPIQLLSGIINGHILILSDSLITVGSGATLENVILSAPVIRLESGWSGALQAIASDSIIVQNDCHLSYPSALILLKSQGLAAQPSITLGDSSTVDGVILTHTSLQKDLERTYVEIGKNSVINGWLYVAGFVFLKGKVHGAVMADYFLFKSSPSVFTNYLVDAEIDRSALSPWFTGPHIFNNDRQSRIIQWVY